MFQWCLQEGEKYSAIKKLRNIGGGDQIHQHGHCQLRAKGLVFSGSDNEWAKLFGCVVVTRVYGEVQVAKTIWVYERCGNMHVSNGVHGENFFTGCISIGLRNHTWYALFCKAFFLIMKGWVTTTEVAWSDNTAQTWEDSIHHMSRFRSQEARESPWNDSRESKWGETGHTANYCR